MKKLEGGEKWMTRCGVMMMMLTLSIAVLGLNIQYTGPNQFAFFVLLPIVDQVVSYFEMRVIAIAIEKMG